MNKFSFFGLCLFLFTQSFVFALIDLEEHLSPFVLETKQIKISEYTDAFNPSIVHFKKSILLIFRIRDPLLKTTNQMGLVFLDKDLNQISKPYLLKMNNSFGTPSMAQDPRLIAKGNDIYILYNDSLKTAFKCIWRMVVGKLEFDGTNFFLNESDMMTVFDQESQNLPEKNWTPFIHDNDLCLTYSLNPFTILKPIFGEHRCETVSSTMQKNHWKYGEIRGGTQSYLIDEEYLGFFHSSMLMATVQSNGKQITHYFMGAYTFSKNPPFYITALSQTPIIGKNFYNGEIHKTWKPLRVVFPSGYIFDDEHVFVAYGRQDHEIWIAKMNLKNLLQSLHRSNCQ